MGHRTLVYAICLLSMGLSVTSLRSASWMPPYVLQESGLACEPSRMISTASIPFYPGAVLVSEYADRKDPRAAECTLTTHDARNRVEAFYKDALTTRGWVIVQEGSVNVRDWDSYGMSFVWRSPNGSLPTRKYLGAAFRLLREGGTEISLNIEPWPDPEQVPIYPGVRNVQTSPAKGLDFDPGPLSHNITYRTNATPAEIEAYYREILPKYGWWLVAGSGPDVETNFGQSDGGEGSSVSVHAEAGPSGETQVVLTVLVGGGNP